MELLMRNIAESFLWNSYKIWTAHSEFYVPFANRLRCLQYVFRVACCEIFEFTSFYCSEKKWNAHPAIRYFIASRWLLPYNVIAWCNIPLIYFSSVRNKNILTSDLQNQCYNLQNQCYQTPIMIYYETMYFRFVVTNAIIYTNFKLTSS